MNAETFFKHFETLAEAPNGVAKLREMILQLAVQGKLVPQDPNDEPAIHIIERINKSRGCDETHGSLEESADMPSSWSFVSISQIADHRLGKMLDKAKNKGELFPYLRNTNVQWWKFDLDDLKEMKFLPDELDEYQVRVGDLLVCEGGEPGRCAVWADANRRLVFQKAIHRIRLLEGISPYFLAIRLRVDALTGRLDGQFTGATIKHFTGKELARYTFGLPPLAEQIRIVEKVDQLMALCDELESRQAARREARSRLVGATLDRLVSTSSTAEFPKHVNRVRDLFDTPTTIPQLRQTILQLAYAGCLLPQNESEGTGSDILRSINKARPSDTTSIKQMAGKKRVLTGDPMNCPGVFNIPSTWSWTYLDFICELIGDVDHNMPKAVSDGVLFLSAKDLKDDGTLDFSDAKMISEEDYERLSRKIKIRRGDIIYSRIGARLGKARLVEVDTRFLISYSCCLVRVLDAFVDRRFVQKFLDSKLALNQAHKGAQSIGVPDLGLGEIKAFQIPLPPLAEQKRIVAKVDQLMTLCDALETKLTASETQSTQLLSAAVHHLLNASSIA